MSRIKPLVLAFIFFASVSPAFAGDSLAVMYQVRLNAIQDMNFNAVLDLSSARLKKQLLEIPEKDRAASSKIAKSMVPISYKVLKEDISPDQSKGSLFLEVLRKLPYVEKPEKQKVEVQFVMEDGKWKVDQECLDTCKNPSAPQTPANNMGSGNAKPLH